MYISILDRYSKHFQDCFVLYVPYVPYAPHCLFAIVAKRLVHAAVSTIWLLPHNKSTRLGLSASDNRRNVAKGVRRGYFIFGLKRRELNLLRQSRVVDGGECRWWGWQKDHHQDCKVKDTRSRLVDDAFYWGEVWPRVLTKSALN